MIHKPIMDENHIYRVEGKVVPGVSSLLVEVGLIDQNVLKFADPTHGTAVHMACEFDDKGILDYDSCNERLKSCLSHWRRFKQEEQLEIVLNEQSLYSRLGYCGTLDRVFKRGDTHILVDIKTSKARSRSTRVQMAFYQRLVEENYDINIDEVWEVVLLEDQYIIVPFDDLIKEEGIMKSILNIHYYKEKK